MAPNRTPDPILTEWTAELHYAIEAGVAPQVALGYSPGPLPALVGLDALRRLVDQRNDLTMPLVWAGGPSGAWLAALMQPQNGTPVHSPSLRTFYTGADPACHVSSGAMLPQHPAGFHAPDSRNLPAGYAGQIAPALQPAAPFAWESMPLRALEPVSGAPVGLPTAGAWPGWLALALATILIVGSLLL